MFNLRNRSVMLFAVMMAILLMVPGAFAQDTFGLSDADFALLSGANAASAAFDSFDYTFTMNVVVEEEESPPVSLTLTGDGVITATAFSMKLDGTAEGLGPIDMDIRFVNDTVYVLGVDPSIGWVSMGESDFGELSGMFGDQLPVDPAGLAQGDTSSLNLPDEAMADIFSSMGTMNPTDYFTLAREADMDGAAVFRGDLLLTTLLQSDMATSIAATGMMQSDPTLTYEAATEQAAGMMTLAGMFLSDSEVSFTQYIDQSSNLVDEAALVISIGNEELGFQIDFEFDVVVEEYGGAYTVEAPAESTPLMDILAAMDALG